MSGTSFTAIMNLPLTEYLPDQLVIIVSLTPNDTAPVVADFPANYQYTVMFSGLTAGTSYTYTVRVVCHSDMTDVVDAFVGYFTIAALRKLPCRILHSSCIIMHAQTEVYGSVCVCVCACLSVCLRLLQLLTDQKKCKQELLRLLVI